MQAEWATLLAGMRLHVASRVVELRRDPEGGAHLPGDLNGSTSGWQTRDLKPENGGTLIVMEDLGVFS